MRLSSSLSKSLLLCVTLLVGQALFAAEQPRQEMPSAKLDSWLQKGDQVLKATQWDPAELLQTAQNLASSSIQGTSSEKGSAALLLSAKLYAKAEKYPECVTSCLQLLDTYPKMAAAPEACELAGTVMADRLGKGLEAAELFEKRVLAYPQEKEAEQFLAHACDLYEKADDWSHAAGCAQKYLDNFGNGPSAMDMRLNLAHCWLMQGKTERAQQSLIELAQRYSNEPLTVVARQTLSEIYENKGATAKANEERRQAWAWYEQHAKSGEKMSGEVRKAAAQALFDLQTMQRAEYHRACAFVPNAVSKVNPKPLAEELIDNYSWVILTDANLAMKAYIAQAEVCEELGNFLLQQGYVRYANARTGQDALPDKAAKEEYLRAIAYYQQAWDYALVHPQTPELTWLSEQAAARAVELRIGNGDLAFGWASQLRRALPVWTGTTHALEQRFDGLNARVYPVLMEGLALYEEAQASAKTMGQSALAERARYGLIVPFEPFVADLITVNRNAWEVATTAAVQIAGSAKMPGTAATALPQFEQLEAACQRSSSFAQQTANRSREIMMALREVHVSPENQTAWEERILNYFNDYAAFCRDMAARLDGTCGELKANKTTRTDELQSRLHGLSRQCMAQESEQLESAYRLCEELAITSPASEKILERLVALNPREYRGKVETQYGTRQRR